MQKHLKALQKSISENIGICILLKGTKVAIHYDGRIEIIKGKVSMLQQKSDKSWKIRITVNSSVWDFTPNEIGTEYFLTKEEAEKALERSENGK